MSGSSSRRGLWIALGAIFIVGGLVAAVLLWTGATQRRNEAIENFARAPIGCDTTLDFIEPGEYLLFVETTGSLEEVRGNCDVEGAYDSADDRSLDVDITIADPDGGDVDIDRSFGDVSYDAGGFAGTARFSVEIEETDDHVLRAESDADEVFVVAVGRDPSEGVAAMRIGAILAGIVGLLVGLVFVLLGSRKSTATVPAGPWTPGAPPQPGTFVPGGAPPQGPPVYGQPGSPPPYGQPPPPGQQPAPFGQPAPGQVATPPAPPQYEQAPPAPVHPPPPNSPQPPAPQPNIPGQPTFPQPPVDPAGSAQPIEWAPQQQAPPPAGPPSQDSSATAPPDAEFLAQLRADRDDPGSTQERRSPPPPE